jgi:hypothetical protein
MAQRNSAHRTLVPLSGRVTNAAATAAEAAAVAGPSTARKGVVLLLPIAA